MPILFAILFIAITIFYPRLARYTLITPILGLTFGGFAWSIAGIFGLIPISWASFLTFVAVACGGVLFLTRDKN